MGDIQIQEDSHELERDKVYICDSKDVDIDQTIDDGYKWHKYGQKSLMENTLVRSYYRCSNKVTRCRAKKCIDHLKRKKIRITTYSFEHNHPPPVNRLHALVHERSKYKLPKQGNLSSASLSTVKGDRRSSLEDLKTDQKNDGSNELKSCKSLEFYSQELECNFKAFVNKRYSSENSGDLEIGENEYFGPYEAENSDIGGRVKDSDVREVEGKSLLEKYETGGFPFCNVSSVDTLASYGDSSCNSISPEINARSLVEAKSLNSMGGNTYENVMLFLGGRSTISIFDFIESEFAN